MYFVCYRPHFVLQLATCDVDDVHAPMEVKTQQAAAVFQCRNRKTQSIINALFILFFSSNQGHLKKSIILESGHTP